LQYNNSQTQGEPYINDDRTLTPAELADIEVEVRRMIAADLDGNTQLAAKMDLDYFSLFANGGDSYYYSYLYADARFPDFETAESFMKVAFTLSAQINIPELQAAQVTATINRSSY